MWCEYFYGEGGAGFPGRARGWAGAEFGRHAPWPSTPGRPEAEGAVLSGEGACFCLGRRCEALLAQGVRGTAESRRWVLDSAEIAASAGISRFSGKRLINSATAVQTPQLIVMQHSLGKSFLPAIH